MSKKERLPRGIRKRGDKFYVDVTVKGIRHGATCETLEEAVVKQKEMRANLKEGAPAVKPNEPVWTLNEALEYTKRNVWSGHKSYTDLVRKATWVVDRVGRDKPVDQVNRAAVDELVEECVSAGNSDKTINRKLSALSRILKSALAREHISHLPPMPRKKENKGRTRFLTEVEEAAVLQTFRLWGRDDHHDAMTVLIDTGLRTSELWRLTDQDVDLRKARGIIHIWESKGGEPRSVPLTSRARSVVENRVGEGRLFPFANHWFEHGWNDVRAHLKLSGDPQFVPHVLRHTCASRLVQRGVPIPVVQKWLGHKNIATTMKYAHLAPDALLEVAHVLEKTA